MRASKTEEHMGERGDKSSSSRSLTTGFMKDVIPCIRPETPPGSHMLCHPRYHTPGARER